MKINKRMYRKELDCRRDDHWLLLMADQFSALIRVKICSATLVPG